MNSDSNKIKQAVILAGGRGERLRPLTDNIPKPMVPVLGNPFLEHLVRMLRQQGIEKVLFLTGYLGDVIEKHFGDGRQFAVAIEYSREKEPLGTGGALKLAEKRLEERFFLLFGDSYLPIDYRKMAEEHIASGKPVTLAVYDNTENTTVPFNVKVDADKQAITAYTKRNDNPADYRYCDAGVLVINKAVVGLIKDAPSSFEEKIYPALIQGGDLGAFCADKRFYDIGTISRLRDFENYIKRTEK